MSMDYLEFLRRVHDVLEPQNYLEIGVRWGHSLGVARCNSVAIDPAFSINQELAAPIHLYRTTSDEYFARPDPLAATGGQPFDLAFVDGLHLFEFALRDFINAERHSRPSGLLIFDDVLPRTVEEAARDRTTRQWTGDVYSIVPVVQRFRPDLITIPIDTTPTGLVLFMGLDPANRALSEHFDEILAEYRVPDPQPVPSEIIDRVLVQQPERVLRSGLLDALAAKEADPRRLADDLRRIATRTLGPATAAR